MSNHKIISEYLTSSADIADLLVDLTEEVEVFNLTLSDLDHFLELEDLTKEEEMRISDLRKKSLVDRRRSKDMIRVIDQILPKQLEGRTTQDRYEYAIRNLEERLYSPRKITLEYAKGEV